MAKQKFEPAALLRATPVKRIQAAGGPAMEIVSNRVAA
jgi:hypothetical protein